jgi:hydrogenase-4 component B
MVTGVPAPIGIELAAALCIGLSGAPGALWPRARRQAIATTLSIAGSALGLAGLALHAHAGEAQAALVWTLPVGRVALALDGLSALFLIPILLVSALGSLYGAGDWRDADRPRDGRRLHLAWGIMTAAMMMVVLADDAILFLVAWEIMALAAFFLICTEEERAEVREASWTYLVATHAGTLCLIGFFALLARAGGSTELWPALDGGSPEWLPTAAFALGLVGFGLKAGLIPLHVWLPGAHASAPSHVSALLSGVLLKTGVYGLVRVCGLLPAPPAWWGGSLLALGVLSGVIGIALAVAQQDVKRLLAYSSIENAGIVAIGIGLATLGRSLGRVDLVALGLGGALFHALNHALFKPLLFLAAGCVRHATGTRQVSALGGLARTMPRTFALFAVGAVAICGLPPTNGFAGELLLYVSLLRTAAVDPAHGPVWAALAAPALAVIGALALAAFVKVAGVAFGGAPRSAAALHAHDPGPAMLAPMAALALACAGLGLAPGAAPPLSALVPLGWISLAGLALVAGVAAVASASRLRRPAAGGLPTWDCGYASRTPRMQYVGASFSEILVGLCGWAVRARRSPVDRSGAFPQPQRFRIVVPDAALDEIALPLFRAVDRRLSRVRVIQRGPVQAYLVTVLLTVVVILVVAG